MSAHSSGGGGGTNTDIRSRATAIQLAINDISQGNISFGNKGALSSIGRDNIKLLVIGGALLGLAIVVK